MNRRLEGLLEFYNKDPYDPFVLYGLALEYMSQDQLQKSEEFFQRLLEQDPDYIAGYIQFAQLREKENKIDQAKELYKRGIEKALRTGDNKSAKEMEDFLHDLE